MQNLWYQDALESGCIKIYLKFSTSLKKPDLLTPYVYILHCFENEEMLSFIEIVPIS